MMEALKNFRINNKVMLLVDKKQVMSTLECMLSQRNLQNVRGSEVSQWKKSAAQESVQKLKEFNISRSYKQHSSLIRRSLSEGVLVATGLAEETIRNSYIDISPHFSKIKPADEKF
ncbi:hypothetical protein YC2023_020153 [Brassica napus]